MTSVKDFIIRQAEAIREQSVHEKVADLLERAAKLLRSQYPETINKKKKATTK